MTFNKKLIISEDVCHALTEGKPIVALESTIISHGMPYPANVETALKVEQIVHENGAVPATIAIINGNLTVGISVDQIDYLGKEGTKVPKASRRDLAVLAAKGSNGATTVSATMIIAAMAGIKVFATGGIGGVHRGAEVTMDISADLEELAETEVLVVCAGIKSILDIGLTLEYLETKGIPIIGYKTKELPAFYTTKSGYNVNYCLDTPKEIATAFTTKVNLGLRGGMVVANPIPEKYAMDEKIIAKAINEAIVQAENLRISGKDITPFLLSKVKDITKGKSLESNIQLVYNNAKLASQIAYELGK